MTRSFGATIYITMDTLPKSHWSARSIPGVIFAILIIILALGSCWVGTSPAGVATWLRPAFSLLGIAGAVLLLTGKGAWRLLLPIWCLLQCWVIATDPSGLWFAQGLMLGVTESRSTSMNGVLVEYSAQGFNLAGLLLLGIVIVLAVLRAHPPIRRPTTAS